MAKKGDPEVLRREVGFLRLHAGMTQAEFGKAAGIDQSDVSRYESGAAEPPEKILRRMAKAAKVPWYLVALHRRFTEAFLAAAARRRAATGAEPLGLGVLEPALLAATPYLIDDRVSEPLRQTPEAARREAAEIWTALEKHPIPHRRYLIELTLEARRSAALAVRICEASVQAAAAQSTKEALELAELAVSIAERVEGEESGRVRESCEAHLAAARRSAGGLSSPSLR